MRSCCNFFISEAIVNRANYAEAKSLICSLVEAFLLLGGLALVPIMFRFSAVVNLHFSCPNSASVMSSCYSYTVQFICLFSKNNIFLQVAMYGEVTSRNHQAYSGGHLVHNNTLSYINIAAVCGFPFQKLFFTKNSSSEFFLFLSSNCLQVEFSDYAGYTC